MNNDSVERKEYSRRYMIEIIGATLNGTKAFYDVS